MDLLIPYQGKSVIIDATVFSTFQACARKGDLSINKSFKSKRGKSVSLEMGIIVHKFLEVYYKAVISGIKKSDALGYGMAAAIEISNNPDEVTNSSDEDKKLAFNTCELYLDYYKNDSWVPLEIEVVKSKQLYQDDEVRIIWKAKIDYIGDSNNGIFNWDHKSMKQRRDSITLNNQFTGQCFIMGTKTMYVNKIGFQTSLKPSERFLRVPISYTSDRMEEWQSEIVPFWVKMMLMYEESQYYPPNYQQCESKFGFCEFKSVCEHNRNMREVELGSEFIVGEKWDIEND